ncbi:hypothetical protein M514_10861, partial [Trichuris suis]
VSSLSTNFCSNYQSGNRQCLPGEQDPRRRRRRRAHWRGRKTKRAQRCFFSQSGLPSFNV